MNGNWTRSTNIIDSPEHKPLNSNSEETRARKSERGEIRTPGIVLAKTYHTWDRRRWVTIFVHYRKYNIWKETLFCRTVRLLRLLLHREEKMSDTDGIKVAPAVQLLQFIDYSLLGVCCEFPVTARAAKC